MKVDKLITLSLSLFVIGLPNLGYSQEGLDLKLEFMSNSSLIQSSLSNINGPLETAPADYSIKPSVKRKNKIETFDFSYRCFDRSTGLPIPGTIFRFESLYAHPYSGGHDHLYEDDEAYENGNEYYRPTGSVYPPEETRDDGTATMRFTAPEVSGYITLTTSCNHPNYNPARYSILINVTYPGLIPMPEGNNYKLIGSWGMDYVTSMHVNNHNARPDVVQSLKNIADAFATAYPGKKVFYNDMSLPSGGHFDIGNKWKNSHKSHRFGNDVDVHPPEPQNRLVFFGSAIGTGISMLINELNKDKNRTTHWHMRYE